MNRKTPWIFVLALAAGSAFAADNSGTTYGEKVQQADGSGPAANAEAAVQRGAKKTGNSVKHGAKKTGQAVGKGLQKGGDAVDRAGEKLEDKSK